MSGDQISAISYFWNSKKQIAWQEKPARPLGPNQLQTIGLQALEGAL
jgi:hypothetical protein